VLNAVGVTGVAAQVYSALIETDEPTASEIAARCGVPDRRAAAELARLTELGLAFRLAGRPTRYRAIAPDVAISELIRNREAELQAARATMYQFTETFRETVRSRSPDGHVEVVRGPANIARTVTRAAEQTRRQLRGFDRPPYTDTPGASHPLQSRRMAAGVTYRVIYDQQALAVPGRMHDDILPGMAVGEQARARPELPIKLIISDDQLALIPAAVTSRAVDTTFIVHKSPILSALITLFEAEWDRATPILGTGAGAFGSARKGGGAGGGSWGSAGGGLWGTAPPDEETASLLSMLAAGMTDAAIARSLDWSIRTTQRRMSKLMTDLGATSRFQAGLAARDRGWI
jgi:Sugar-specific transcriptional regulator TrmB